RRQGAAGGGAGGAVNRLECGTGLGRELKRIPLAPVDDRAEQLPAPGSVRRNHRGAVLARAGLGACRLARGRVAELEGEDRPPLADPEGREAVPDIVSGEPS